MKPKIVAEKKGSVAAARKPLFHNHLHVHMSIDMEEFGNHQHAHTHTVYKEPDTFHFVQYLHDHQHFGSDPDIAVRTPVQMGMDENASEDELFEEDGDSPPLFSQEKRTPTTNWKGSSKKQTGDEEHTHIHTHASQGYDIEAEYKGKTHEHEHPHYAALLAEKDIDKHNQASVHPHYHETENGILVGVSGSGISGSGKTSSYPPYTPYSYKACHEGNILLFRSGNVAVYGGGSSRKVDTKAPEIQVVLDLAGITSIGKGGSEFPKSWRIAKHTKPLLVLDLYITDYQPPSYSKEFWADLWLDLVDEAARQGKTEDSPLGVIATCSGGHGRTGTVLAILAHVSGIVQPLDDAAMFVRKHYCEEAIESESQLSYLKEKIGIKTVALARQGVAYQHGTTTPNLPATIPPKQDGLAKTSAKEGGNHDFWNAYDRGLDF